MKPNRIIDHRQRIRRVAAYIDDHLDEKLNLPTLAAVACLSPFHFQRVYQLLVGETPADTVRRLRLKRAASQIANGETSVTEAATLAGYGSSQAFCRAFRRDFGVAPSRLKKAGPAWLADRTPPQPGFSVLELPAQVGYGVRFGGADWEGDWSCCQVIGRVLAGQRWNPMADGLFMQYRSDPLTSFDGPADADICIVGRDPVPGMNELDEILLPGGTFAAMVMPGSLAGALQDCRHRLQMHLPALGLLRRRAPVLRRFLNDPVLTPPSERLFEIYVPVMAESSAGVDDRADAASGSARPPERYAAAG